MEYIEDEVHITVRRMCATEKDKYEQEEIQISPRQQDKEQNKKGPIMETVHGDKRWQNI
jgi:hypothetical protein